MPSALDPIASDIGHGRLGLRDNLRPFTELLLESQGQKHVFVELRGSKIAGTGWQLFSGQTWNRAIRETFDGLVLDVVGVRIAGATLTAADSVAACLGLPGSFIMSLPANVPAVADSDPRWDDGVAHWDDGTTTWDREWFLYVNLPDGSNPNSADVLIQLAFYFSNVSVHLPRLGPSTLVDGGLEAWSGPTDLTNYTEAVIGAGGGTPNKDQAIFAPDGGVTSCRFEGPFNAAGGQKITQTVSNPTVWRSVSGWYRTDPANAATVTARIAVLQGANWLLADGINVSASETWLDLTPTNGEWRRFVFHFQIGTGSSHTAQFGAYNSSGGALAGKVWFDGLSNQRIRRWNYHEPALAGDSVPGREVQRTNRFGGRWSVGIGTLTLLNSGRLQSMFGSFDFAGQEALVRIGGRFGDGGNEILAEDLWTSYLALTKAPRVNDSRASIALEDLQSFWSVKLPSRTLAVSDLPLLLPIDQGRLRALAFGTCPRARPAEIDYDANANGNFETIDPLYLIAGASQAAPINAWVYEDTQAANEQDVAKRIVATSGTEWAWVPGTAQMDFSKGAAPFRFELGISDVLDFVSNSVTRVGTLTAGLYNPPGMAAHVQAVMRAATGAADVNVTFDEATDKFTVAYIGAGNFQLLTNSGTNKQRSGFPIIGLVGAASADLTGAITYTGAAITGRSDLRCDVKGYTDDASGTYTGLANAQIQLGADILAFLLRKVLGFPVDRLDLPSFVAARALGPQLLAVYLGVLDNGAAADTALELGEIVDRIEKSTGLELVLDGDVFRLRGRDTTTPASILDLYDRDFLDFDAWQDAEDVFGMVRLTYGQDAGTGLNLTTEKSSALTQLRYNRADPLEFSTFLSTLTDALNRRDAWFTEATTVKNRYAFAVKGSCLKKVCGDKVRLNKTGMLGGVGKVVRILRHKYNSQTWVSEIEAVEI